ncbi:hypothetical protein V1477_013324 [Vespula maculifrons]|uniref:Uncharacterized protein n=1 Tax=Vespula maculifrons TaxID=7453 RepID=A0ABD2BQL3_VESMC
MFQQGDIVTITMRHPKRSNSEKSIRLANVRLETSGQYKCEVSTEGPSFASFHKTANLTIDSTISRSNLGINFSMDIEIINKNNVIITGKNINQNWIIDISKIMI